MAKLTQLLTATLLFMLLNNPAVSQNTTLQDIFSAPITMNLTASEAGGAFAWVFNHEGRHSIYTAFPPGYEPERLVHYSLDDGKGISSLQFSPDGLFLVYTLGSQFNPTSDPDGAGPEIFRVEADTGELIKLASGSNPVLSPDGQAVVFSYQGRIMSVPVDGSEDAEQIFTARGSNHSLQFSPDGSKILFVSSREVHSFIGVYHVEEHSISWVDPDVYRDLNPVWSPDGSRIAFIRVPGGMHHEFPMWRRGDLPFSIRVHNLSEKTTETVWETETGGGFAQTYPGSPLSWAIDDNLVFYSEHTGWMNLWSVDTETGEFRALVSGDFEVEEMALTHDRKYAVFNSNEGDINRRHIWKVPVAGGERVQLTSGNGVEWSPVPGSGGQIAFIRSDAQLPGQPAVMDSEGNSQRLLARASVPDRFPERNLVVPQEVSFTADDGVEVHGQLFLPPGYSSDSSHPAVIYMHGGPIRQMYPAWHHSGYYHYNYGFNQYLALNGYVVLSVNFRAGIGYGKEFRTAPEQGPRGASEYQDILAAAKFLQYHDAVDPLKLGLWGGSYGGLLTAMGLARNSDLFAAGVDLHGVHDWALRGERRNGGGWGIYTEKQRELAYHSSPVHDVESWTSPVLFVHADDDRNVDFIQTTDLVRRLQKEGKAHVETLVFPDDVHSFLLHRNWIRTFEASADFFERFLDK